MRGCHRNLREIACESGLQSMRTVDSISVSQMLQRNEPTITDLLARVSEISKKHALVAEMTGERFNVFFILGLETKENQTHSAFIRELLDPQGSHGQKDAFLKSFIRIFGIQGYPESSGIEATVTIEKHIGFISDDYSNGGRVDITIEPKGQGTKVLIENKIYASDQKRQLVRYHNYDKNSHLLYLTLRGNKATECSTILDGNEGHLKEGTDYFSVSYEKHILTWLENCKKEAASHPLVRETISQYINLIRHLTHKSINYQMDQEIEKIIVVNEDVFASSKKIADAYNSIVCRTRDELKNRLDLSKEEFVSNWKTFKIFIILGSDGGPYLAFDVFNQAGQKVGVQTGPEFEQLRSILSRLSFNQNKWHIGWKYFSYWHDENELLKLCRLSHDEAYEELIREKNTYIELFKSEVAKLQLTSSPAPSPPQ